MESKDIFPNIRIFSVLYDAKIDAYNVSFELPKSDYIAVIPKIKQNNELQRNRIARRSSVQSLMKDDLKQGCLLPAITLALPIKDDTLSGDLRGKNIILSPDTEEKLKNFIRQNYQNIKILDGLQRTNSIMDIHGELSAQQESESTFYDTDLRFELYLGANKFGILYRMLTLNTGQTPMTLRHQIEIMYYDIYPETGETSDGIQLIREIDAQKPSYGKYGFQSMIDGIEAYFSGSPIPLDRFDVIEYVSEVKAISAQGMIGNSNIPDAFDGFVKLYHAFVSRLREIFGDTTFDIAHIESNHQDLVLKYRSTLSKKYKLFAHNIIEFLTKGQAISAFGAAISGQDFSQIQERFPYIVCNGDVNETFSLLIARMAELNQKGGNIGNAQRDFLYLFLKKLFGAEVVSIEKALSEAFRGFNLNPTKTKEAE